MKDYGLVSIIMPSYNSSEYIKDTINSVINQTYENWELIIVDDCSADCTDDVVNELSRKDERIKYYKLETNSGAAVARTKAMDLSNGKYMAFLDSDDLWVSEKLEKQLAFMEMNDYAFTCTSYQQIEEESGNKGKIIKSITKTDYNRLLLDCPVGNSTVMYNVEKMGKFKVPNIRKRNDDALWLQMLKKEKYIYGMPEILSYYKIRTGSLSNNKWKVVKYHWELYRDIEHLSVSKSIFHIAYWVLIKLLRIK